MEEVKISTKTIMEVKIPSSRIYAAVTPTNGIIAKSGFEFTSSGYLIYLSKEEWELLKVHE